MVGSVEVDEDEDDEEEEENAVDNGGANAVSTAVVDEDVVVDEVEVLGMVETSVLVGELEGVTDVDVEVVVVPPEDAGSV